MRMPSIVELERIAAAHWRGTEEEWFGDWLLRAGGGFTGRANSALALGDPPLPLDAALAAVTGWYHSRGLPPQIAVPLSLDASGARDELDAELAARNWSVRPGVAFVMAAGLPLGGSRVGDAGDIGDRELRVSDEPDDGWLATYHYRGAESLPAVAMRVLTSCEDQAFVSLRDGDDVLAIARLSVAAGWAGISAVEVHPDYRRRGLGIVITAAACGVAESRGVPAVFLQTEVRNAAARALYERIGFSYTHRYHYRLAPKSPGE
jgi:ribosomal protein S18 acetylase RimI-like enzyme